MLEIPGGTARTRSPAEREMVRLLRRGGLSGYEVNARIGGYEVDFLWRDAGLALEVDGYAAHSGRGAFERDRLKIARLKSRGIDVVPVTPRRIRDHPQATLELIRRALERARAGPASNARTIHPR